VFDDNAPWLLFAFFSTHDDLAIMIEGKTDGIISRLVLSLALVRFFSFLIPSFQFTLLVTDVLM
jgi:hypothetical protein